MKTVLITGINGALGSQLAKRLSQNCEIIGIEAQTDNLFRLDGCNFKVISSLADILSDLFENTRIDIIIHTATIYGRNNESIPQIAETNLFMPLQLLDLAIKKGTSTFINTDTVLDKFVSSYALTKNQMKEWLFFRSNEIRVINMQLEHFFGPGCSSSNFITNMIENLRNNPPEIKLTLGEQLRDFVYFDDVVNAFEIIVNKCNEIPSGSNYQVGSGEHISIKDLVIFLKTHIGSKSELNFGAIPYRENELMISETNIAPLCELGWKPKYTIREGLLKTISI